MAHDESVPFVIHAFAKRSTEDVFLPVPRSITKCVWLHGDHINGQTSRCQRGRSDCDGTPVILGMGGNRRGTSYARSQFFRMSFDDKELLRGIE